MIAPTGRSLLAEVTNSRPNDNPAMHATRHMGSSSANMATTMTSPMTSVTSTSSAEPSTALNTRSGRFRKNTT